MRLFLRIIFILIATSYVGYSLLPNPEFPKPPNDAVQSREPGDSETPLRRGYFTNLTREEVIAHYGKEFARSTFLNLPLPTLRLNYPPEESVTLIRDQTRSTFLEELTHPFRESIYVNGFEPKDPKDAILIDGKNWRQKIIIRQVPSKMSARLVITTLTLSALFLLLGELKFDLSRLKELSKKG